MQNNIILENILTTFRNQGFTQVEGYNRFGYVMETDSTVVISREAGKDTKIPFAKIIVGIEAVQKDSTVYNDGPNRLREFGVTHVNSPIWSLLHLVPKSEY